MGRLMVIDGLDGCGKSTQLALLQEKLEAERISCRQISFPDYDQPSSALVKMYLSGSLGGSPTAVNAYAASSFYAVDRYASYRSLWQEDYEKGVPIVAARYTTSNAIHQMTKLPEGEWDSFMEWLWNYEYEKLELPRPDRVVFLDMPLEVSQKLLSNRYAGDEEKKDIHERDTEYLSCCRRAALYAAASCGWTVISCAKDGAPRPREEIQAEIQTVFSHLMD